ncbi:MAG: PQQ-binding-like beta-propeller repeat protein [Pirellulaceae bacterium]
MSAIEEYINATTTGKQLHMRSLTRIILVGVLAVFNFGGNLNGNEHDWPMWRYDAARSAATPLELSEDLHLQWVRELPEPKRAWRHQWDHRGKLDFDVSYAPVVMGERIFVPSNATDSVTAYRIANGARLWRFYADGPVRLAPAAWNGNVYFVSDDGHLYCVEAETGDLVWKFRGGPSDHRLLGNERIINFWPARGGPVVKDGTVYFAAGVWPLHGVFIHAIDAESGEPVWVNDTTSSDYVQLPHGGAEGYGGLAPQGYIAASEDQVVVSAGRGPNPVRFDRHTGKVLQSDYRGQKGHGHYAVHSEGMGFQRNEMIESRVEALSDQIDGAVFAQIAAHERLFVTTEDGTLYCFGPEEIAPRRYEYRPAALKPRTDDWAALARNLLEQLDDSRGYALMLGAGSGDLLRELLNRSDLHVVVAEADAEKARDLRDELVDAGMYGRRAAMIEADPATFSVQPYLFSLIASESATDAGIDKAAVLADMMDKLRPYSGVAYLNETTVSETDVEVAMAGVDQVLAGVRKGQLVAKRGGPLSGAGQWTHQHHDALNTNLSHDERVRLPLGILWFGGPNNHNVLPRHANGPRPQVAGGRQVFLGVETIAARDVYTGRALWEREFSGIGHPFTDLELEKEWARGKEVYMSNIPGAVYIGSPFVTTPDSVYLRHEEKIYRLDAATGETLAEFSLPGQSLSELYPEEDVPDWGTMRVAGNFLITTSEPHVFEDQKLGWNDSYSGTSSRRIAVLDRYNGEVLWDMGAEIGFRHNAIIATDKTLYVIDGLSEKALEYLGRRGKKPENASQLLAMDLATGETIWSTRSDVFGTYLAYSSEHDILVEGGNTGFKMKKLEDEPLQQTMARRGETGEVLWRGGSFTLPGAMRGEMLIPGNPGNAISLLTGETWMREQPRAGEQSAWTYGRQYGCNQLNASQHLLLFRTGYAGYFDLEHDAGTGNFSGIKSGCTANMLAADGVLNALDYTRSCTCSYPHQTSLALVHMPGDSNIEFWMRHAGTPPAPANHGLNFGAPGRRVDVAGSGRIWHDRPGTRRRHPSAIADPGGSLAWVAASAREIDDNEPIVIEDLPDGEYTLRLHFAELDETVAPAQRVFDVLIDGEEILTAYDIVDKTGGVFRAIVESAVRDAGGTMTIEFRETEDSQRPPMINGVEIISE